MRAHRLLFSLLALALMLGPTIFVAPAARAADQWTAATAPPSGLARNRAALLPDGQVYVRGDEEAGRYDPVADRWTTIGTRLNPRNGAAMATLHSGVVMLIAGTSCGHCGGYNVELYDPRTDAITFAASSRETRARHTATTLADGRVLIAGGAYDPSKGPYASTEIYDPVDNRWADGPPMLTGRLNHTSTLLGDGRVLVVGDGKAEIYDPATNRWTPAASPSTARARHTATLLADGTVLIAGGDAANEAAPISLADRRDGPPLATAERYDPATDRWSAVAALPGPRTAHTATLLDDGQLLLVGGRATADIQSDQQVNPASTLRFDPATGSWQDAGTLAAAPVEHSATLLLDGRVLIIGAARTEPYRTTSLYADTAARLCAPAAGGSAACVSGRFLASWRAHGGLAINGYPLSPLLTETLEDGSARVVQYFERVRMEWHPETADPRYRILLGQFGRQILAGVPDAPTTPVAALPGATFFEQTGHNVTRPEFVTFWRANGGLAQFGFPLSEEFTERLEDGREYRVQYFERARLEWHPGNADPNKVQLGHFGRRILDGR